MMRLWMRGWILACLAFVLVACGGSDGSDDATIGTKAKTTLLMYVVASDLTGSTAGELMAMAEARSSADVNVVLQIGGGDEAGPLTPDIDMRQTRRYRFVPKSGTWDLKQVADKDQPGQVAMSEGSTLRDFVQWGASAFPAEQYVLSMLDHGGGPVAGFGSDQALGGGKMLQVAEMRSALAQAGVHFELINFDACLMGSLELASALAPHANYLSASEEVTWIGSDRWTDTLGFLSRNPEATGDVLGRVIVDNYRKALTGMGGEQTADFTAYSVTDLRQVPALVEALDTVADTLHATLRSQGLAAWQAMAVARRESQDFQTNIFSTRFDLMDAGSWIDELVKVQLLTPKLAASFHAQYQRTVVYADGFDEDVTGLSLYFPRYSTLDQPVLNRYTTVGFSPAYQGLVLAFAEFARTSDEMPRIDIGPTQALDGALVADVQTHGGKGGASNALLGRPYDAAFGVLIKDGVAVAMRSASPGAEQIRLDSPQRWPAIDGGVVTLLPEDDDDDGTYVVPVANEQGSHGVLIVIREDDGRLVIRGYADHGRLVGSAASLLAIAPGTRFFPLGYNIAGNDLATLDTPLVAPDGEWQVRTTTVAGDAYAVALAASNLTGQLVGSTQGAALPAQPQ